MERITIDEWYTTKIYALSNRAYNSLIKEFTKIFVNEYIAKRFIQKHWNDTIQELSANSFVDVKQFFTII